jgi:hypothetical protein
VFLDFLMHLPAFFFVIIAYMPCFYSFFCLCGKICDEQGEFHIYIYILAYIAPFIVLKPGPAGRLGTRSWSQTELKKNRERKNPVWPGDPVDFCFFFTKTTLFWFKKKNWSERPGDPVKTWNRALDRAGSENYGSIGQLLIQKSRSCQMINYSW